MLNTFSFRNRIASGFCFSILPALRVRRPLAAAVVAVCLAIAPALAEDVPKAEPATASSKDQDISGSLVIVGGGDLPTVIRDQFLKLAGGKKAKLVVIPTASEQADRTHQYLSYEYWKAQEQELTSVSMLHTLDHNQANDPSFVKPLTEATAVWLGGGDQTRLADAYRGTAVEKELRGVLARCGVVGGTSAGASAMSTIMITGGNPQASVGTGFGLLPDVVIDQHFRNRQRQKRLLGVLEKHPRCLGLGIDEGTAVVVSGHVFTVLGKGSVSVCLPPLAGANDDVKLLKSDDTGDLLQLNHSVLARLKVPSDGKPMAAKTVRATAP